MTESWEVNESSSEEQHLDVVVDIPQQRVQQSIKEQIVDALAPQVVDIMSVTHTFLPSLHVEVYCQAVHGFTSVSSCERACRGSERGTASTSPQKDRRANCERAGFATFGRLFRGVRQSNVDVRVPHFVERGKGLTRAGKSPRTAARRANGKCYSSTLLEGTCRIRQNCF